MSTTAGHIGSKRNTYLNSYTMQRTKPKDPERRRRRTRERRMANSPADAEAAKASVTFESHMSHYINPLSRQLAVLTTVTMILHHFPAVNPKEPLAQSQPPSPGGRPK